MNYIYVDVNQWDLLLETLHPNIRLTYESGDGGNMPTHKGKPVILIASFWRGEQQDTVGFVRETALTDE